MIDVPMVGAIKMPCAADTVVLSTVSLVDKSEEEPIMDIVTTDQNQCEPRPLSPPAEKTQCSYHTNVQ